MYTILVGGTMLLIKLIIYVFHLTQKSKIEKDRRIAELTYRHKASNIILSSSPPQFLNKELTKLLLQEIIKTLTLLQRENPKTTE